MTPTPVPPEFALHRAPDGVRRRVRARWERRRAETDGPTVAFTSWSFDGRHTYPLRYTAAVVVSPGAASLADSQKALIAIERETP